MDIDTESIFGDHTRVRNFSDSEDVGDHTRVRNFSDSEDEYDDDPDPEARRQVEAPDGQGQEATNDEVPNDGEAAKKIEPAKVKRVIKNPQPKLDPQRLAGPRGMFHVQKLFKDVKWKGKGYEKDDLSILLKRLEHWAHRLYPKLPFQDTLDQIEKLGMKKNVQVHMKRIRLDMVNEYGRTPEEEDDVSRGPEPEEAEHQVDVFDELIGENFSSEPPTATQIFTSPTAPPPSIPKPNPSPLTAEQKERLERNRRLAEEKRKARFLQQMEQKQAEASAAISKGDKAEGIEFEKENSERKNENSELKSTNLSVKENEKSSEESKTGELNDTEVGKVESDKTKDFISSTTKSLQEIDIESTSDITINKSEKDKTVEDVDIASGENKSQTEIEMDNISENVKEQTSDELSQKTITDSESKKRESDEMEVDEIESDKTNDVSSTTKSSQKIYTVSNSDRTGNTYEKDKKVEEVDLDSGEKKGKPEIEMDNISENVKEQTSDDLSQNTITDSDSKKRESDEMEVDEIESDKTSDVASSATKSSQEKYTLSNSDRTVNTYEEDKTIEDVDLDSGENKGKPEIEMYNISENVKEQTSDELSQKTITDSDSKDQNEGICTEEEMLAMLDDDL